MTQEQLVYKKKKKQMKKKIFQRQQGLCIWACSLYHAVNWLGLNQIKM